jgi:capping protein beta
MLQLITRRESAEADVASWKHDGEISLSGSMTRQVCNTVMWLERLYLTRIRKTEQDHPVLDGSSHVQNVGRMVEDMEIKMRNLLQEVYFGKTRDVVHDLRSLEDLEKARRQRELQRELVGFIKR